jgi:cell division transport system ATP-binding protein
MEEEKSTARKNVIAIENGRIDQQRVTVLKDLTISIAAKEFAYLIGKTGTGKSSFLKVLYGELPLVEGTGQVAGFNVAKLKKKEVPLLRRKLGIVFQDFQLLTDRKSTRLNSSH